MPSVTLVPSGYTGLTNMTINASYPIERGYTNADSTNYTRFDVTQSRTGEVYFTFDTSDIPSGATITSVSARGKARVSNTTRVSSTVMQFYSGSTAKGNNRTFASTTASTQTITVGSWTRAELSNLRLKIGGTASSSSSSRRIDFYGADFTVEYTAGTVYVTGVTLDKSTDSVEQESTTTLTATIAPADATDKAVTWSSSNTSVATVADGVVTGVGPGTATITVTTHDGGYTDTCLVTVTAVTYTQYYQASSMIPGKSYIIASGNTGTVNMLTNESAGARTLTGVTTTVANGIISLTGSQSARVLMDCVRYTAGNDVTITVSKNGQYLYSDNSSGLRFNAPATLDRFWHFKNNKFWQFKSTASDGYDDTSTEYKYYITWSNGNATDNHVTSPSIEESEIPLVYLFCDSPEAPTITVGTPSRSIISDETGYDQSVCTFTSNIDLQAWEARATKEGTTPARGVGLLVESGTTLAAGATGTVTVDNEELTNGDGEYTITVYGQSTGGVWSG